MKTWLEHFAAQDSVTETGEQFAPTTRHLFKARLMSPRRYDSRTCCRSEQETCIYVHFLLNLILLDFGSLILGEVVGSPRCTRRRPSLGYPWGRDATHA